MSLIEFEDLPSTETAIDATNLNNNFNYLEEKATISDTGWIEIKQTDLAQGTVVTGYYVPAYRKIGNVVYLKGQINGVTSRATEIFTLPSGFYNSTARLNFCSTNDATNVNFVRITNAGVVVLQRSDGDFTQGINVYLDDIRFLVD